MMENTVAAVRKHGTKLVFFDNTYMYPQGRPAGRGARPPSSRTDGRHPSVHRSRPACRRRWTPAVAVTGQNTSCSVK